ALDHRRRTGARVGRPIRESDAVLKPEANCSVSRHARVDVHTVGIDAAGEVMEIVPPASAEIAEGLARPATGVTVENDGLVGGERIQTIHERAVWDVLSVGNARELVLPGLANVDQLDATGGMQFGNLLGGEFAVAGLEHQELP